MAVSAPPVPLRRNREFRLLWCGHAVSELGSSISLMAYPLLVLAITGPAADAGLVTFLGALPFTLLQLPAGMAFVGPIWNVVIGAYEIRLTPDALLSRVASVAGMIAIGVIPFGSLITGLLLGSFGAQTTLILLSVFMFAIAVAATLNRNVRAAPALA